MVAIVSESGLNDAIRILKGYGISTPVYSRLEYKGSIYYVFEKAPAAALMLIQLEKGVHIDGVN